MVEMEEKNLDARTINGLIEEFKQDVVCYYKN